MINLYIPQKSTSLPTSCHFCHHRLSVDFQELFNPNIRMSSNKCFTKIDPPFFSNSNYIINCEIVSKEGFYRDILFKMKIIISKEYPFVAPKIFSLTKVVHPNIHMKTGEVSIAMLRETEWIPVLNLNFILFALELVIIQPNIDCTPDCAQNYDLVNVYQRDLDLFEALIEESKVQINLFQNTEKMKVEGEEEEEEKQSFMSVEKHLSQFKMNESFMKSEGIIRALKYDFDKHEPRKREILNQLTETLAIFETTNPHSKKRYRDQENLINPFLKKVRISST